MSKKLKKPSDYPQFYCRMEAEDKEEIEEILENILSMSVKLRKSDTKKLKRNYIIQRALKGGLKAIEKRYEERLEKKKK